MPQAPTTGAIPEPIPWSAAGGRRSIRTRRPLLLWRDLNPRDLQDLQDPDPWDLDLDPDPQDPDPQDLKPQDLKPQDLDLDPLDPDPNPGPRTYPCQTPGPSTAGPHLPRARPRAEVPLPTPRPFSVASSRYLTGVLRLRWPCLSRDPCRPTAGPRLPCTFGLPSTCLVATST